MTPMEQLLSSLPESITVRALQSLLPALISHWNDPEGFRRAATPRFMGQAGIPRSDAAKAVAVVDQAMRQAVRMRAAHFRPFTSEDDLEFAYSKIVPTSADSPSMQGSLWLAFQAQRQAVEFLGTTEGIATKADVIHSVDVNKAVFQAMGAEAEGLSLAKIERIIVTIGRKMLDEKVSNFKLAAVAGYIIETARREARSKSDGNLLSSRAGRLSEELRMLVTILEPVYRAELNEANQRFMRLSSVDKGRRFDQLRTYLNRRSREVAKLAPPGFEKFCQSVESQLFAYPTQIEWLRSYLKPLYNNAEQSSIFDNCLTEASIRQRYEKVLTDKNPNVIMIELARAFAITNLSQLDDPGQREFLAGLDLRQEFGWPVSLEELQAQVLA